MKITRHLAASCLVILSVAVFGCAHRLVFGKPVPAPELRQAPGARVADDGTVTLSIGRLEVSLRPVADDELNRSFPSQLGTDPALSNPYTYADWKDWRTGQTPPRFTVFFLKVKNYAYPKIRLNSLRSLLVTGNGRQYSPISWLDFVEGYYRAFTLGYAGNSYRRFDEHQDILRKTLYPDDMVFSGQERDGYVVFPRLNEDVRDLTVSLRGVDLRFDFRGEPVESTDLDYVFERAATRL